jgi:hypothetical protein
VYVFVFPDGHYSDCDVLAWEGPVPVRIDARSRIEFSNDPALQAAPDLSARLADRHELRVKTSGLQGGIQTVVGNRVC